MKNGKSQLSLLAIRVLCVAALVCTTGMVYGACTTANCTDDCFVWKEWCIKDSDTNATEGWKFPIKIVFRHPDINKNCTNGQAPGGNPALQQLMDFDIYDICADDCFRDVSQTVASTGAINPNNRIGGGAGIFNTDCTSN